MGKTKNLLAMLLIAAAATISGCSGVPKFSRFEELCKTAGLNIDRRAQSPAGILLDRSQIYSKSGKLQPGYTVLPGPLDILSNTNIRYVDELTTTGTRYRRILGIGTPIIRTDSDAELLLRIRFTPTDEEADSGIMGYEITLIERKTEKTISRFRYFFIDKTFEICPSAPDRKGIQAAKIAAYMIGLSDPSLEPIYRRNWIP